MTYKEVIKDSKFYLPMNLNLAYLISGDETVLLMTIINCYELKNKVSIRKLMKFCNVNSNSYMQTMIRHLRKLKMIEQNGYVPNYETLKYIFEKVNNAKSIDDRIKWCELYSREVQNNVPLGGTQNCTPERYTYKEDVNKKDINNKNNNIYNNNNILEEIKPKNYKELMEYFKKRMIEETKDKNFDELNQIQESLKDELDLFNEINGYENIYRFFIKPSMEKKKEKLLTKEFEISIAV